MYLNQYEVNGSLDGLGELGSFWTKIRNVATAPLRATVKLVKKDPLFKLVKKSDAAVKKAVGKSPILQKVIYAAGVVAAPFTGGASLAIAAAAVQSAKAQVAGRSFGAQFAQGVGAGAIGWVAGAGIAYVAGTAGVGSGVFGSTAPSAAATAAASDAGMLYAPAGASALAPAATGITTASALETGFTAAGLLKSVAGYVGTAKDVYGVVNAVRGGQAAQQSAVSSGGGYGYGGGAAPGGGGRSDQGTSFADEAGAVLTSLTTGRTPYYIGAGLLAIIAVTSMNKPARRRTNPARRRSRRRTR